MMMKCSYCGKHVAVVRANGYEYRCKECKKLIKKDSHKTQDILTGTFGYHRMG